MRFSAPPLHDARRDVWGRVFLPVLLASLLFSAVPAEAASGNAGNRKADAATAKRAAHDARVARRHPKLDLQLNDAVEDAVDQDSDVIIMFNDESAGLALVKAAGGKAGRRLGILNARVARLPNRKLKALANDPRVKAIRPDREVKGFVGRTAVTVGARAVHQLMGYTGAGIGVAIIDSGVTNWHDDLSNGNLQGQRVTHFADFVNGQIEAYDDWGHGTHVAGIVAGNGFDTNGTRSAIAPGANIIALKALNANGTSTISTIIAAIDYAVTNKDALNIRVLNMSLGAGVSESYLTDPLTLAAKRAVDAGIVVVAAAGNLGKAANGLPQYGAIGSPGNAPWVITVGASSTNGTVRRQDDTIAAFSSRGPTMYDFLAKPDLVAPGTGTVSLADPLSAFYVTKAQYLLQGLLETGNAPYLSLSGTSMAAPVVAGSIALMLEANPSLTPNLVKAILQFTAQEYPGYDALTQGTGFLNARGAVRLAEYFRQAQPGSSYPSMSGWSRQIFWGNRRVRGGILTPGGTAWGSDVIWGSAGTPSGSNIVWGDNCVDTSCENVVWGNGDDDNVVWGNSGDDNVVWGNSGDDNVVWGNDCGGEDCNNVVWGNSGGDNVVWGNAEGIENVVWGNSDDDNVVWGNSDDDNVVWGNSGDDNVVWGNSTIERIVFGDETVEVNSLPAGMWDQLFPLDAQWPMATVVPTVTTNVMTSTTWILTTVRGGKR